MIRNDSGQAAQTFRYGEPEFRTDAIAQLPELAQRVEQHAGNLHVVFMELNIAGRSAIETGDFDFLRRLFALLTDAIAQPGADPEIENAVVISFLMPDDFTGANGDAAWALLPERLSALIREAV